LTDRTDIVPFETIASNILTDSTVVSLFR
jgi:hypothetical protein